MKKNKPKIGYKFTKYEYTSPAGMDTICSAKITHEIPYQDLTWCDLLDQFRDFVRGCGFSPPDGELVWLEKNEVVMTKAEAVLYGKPKEEVGDE